MRRNRIGERTVPVTTAEQIARTVALAVILSMGGGAVLTPPDPYSQIRFLGPSLLATLPLAYGLLVGRDLVRADPDVIE